MKLLLLLLLLSRFSRVQPCATPQTAAHQAPPSLGLSRQEHWSGLPFPSPMHESEKWKWSRSVMPGFAIHGLQSSRLPHPWDFPGKSTGVGWHCLHQHFRLGMVNYGRLWRPKSMVYLYIPKSKIKKLKKKTYQIAIKHFLERLPVRCV